MAANSNLRETAMRSAQQLPRPDEVTRTQPPMVYVREEPVWEYKYLRRNLAQEELPTENELNALGADGWELAGVVTLATEAHFCFKRLAR